MIWAAAYAASLDLSNPPGHIVRDMEAWGEWEAVQVQYAMEAAGTAVEHVRKNLRRFEEGFEGTDLYGMAYSMVYNEDILDE